MQGMHIVQQPPPNQQTNGFARRSHGAYHRYGLQGIPRARECDRAMTATTRPASTHPDTSPVSGRRRRSVTGKAGVTRGLPMFTATVSYGLVRRFLSI